MAFNEDFLHFVWQYRLFDQKNLLTSSGELVEITHPGFYNTNAGADFENAKIKIGGTVWVGNVEIHLKSSDWDLHSHNLDKAYNNVVLHVVYHHDKAVYRTDQTEIVTLVLKDHILPGLELRYKELLENLAWIPCEKTITNIKEIHLENWLSRVLIERLEEKSKFVLELLDTCRGSWDDLFYLLLARNFGFNTNAFPFELLAMSLPQQILAKHKNNPTQIEALVFGQAGFLNQPVDAYASKLREEYVFLQKKYNLQAIEQHLWKFLRLRPQNFPTIRLAQFAALIVRSNHLFSKLLDIRDVKEIVALFKNLEVHEYWQTHYRFGKTVKKASSHLGSESIHNIILNSVVTILFSYGKYLGKQYLVEKALEMLESLPPEGNNIIQKFEAIGVKADSAAKSQALLQLKKYYCDKKKCLNCAVGVRIVKVA